VLKRAPGRARSRGTPGPVGKRSGRTFQFTVKDAVVLKGLKVGQAIYADFTTLKVSVNPDGVAPCCSLVNLKAPAATTVK